MDCRRFKGYMAINNIKQTEIAELLDISIQSVNKKVNGKEDFTLPQIRTLCQHFSISADDFFV